jgi:hypothetical protein
MYTRREWAAMMASAIDSRIKGVRIGLQTYVFTANTNLPQDRWLDLAIQTMTEAGIGECDLFAPLTDAPDLWRNGRPARADVAAWRASVSLDHFTVIRKRFHDAGI